MINNSSGSSLQLKILAQVEAFNKKKHPEDKLSYMKLNKREEAEAEELFDGIEVS